MTSQNAIVEATPSVDLPGSVTPDAVTIETRFGTMEFQLHNAVHMPRGMLGYADYHSFGLANLPDPKLDHFKLFQCLEESSLSFIIAPLGVDNETIDPKDVEAACETLSIDPANAVVLLVVSTRKLGPATQISVNLRAPILLDGESQTAYQHVLMNNQYPVRKVIGTSPTAAG
jgi:flagellar assembly factor FliW